MTKSNESLASKSHNHENAVDDLVFPDWSGMTRVPIRISFRQAYEHNLKLITMLPPKPGESERRRARKCTVEFTL
jgi:hypothetical protein